jgi:hypothetical protein
MPMVPIRRALIRATPRLQDDVVECPRMSILASSLLALLLIALILYFASREVAAYRRDRDRTADLYPYTEVRLVRRLGVTVCLIAEVILLALVRFTLSPAKPLWFLLYVSSVLFLVLVMIVLSLLDLRESIRLRKWSLERLKKEFIWKNGEHGILAKRK